MARLVMMMDIPRYIGLRVKLNIPVVTIEDARSIWTGLIVVLAFRNDRTADMSKNKPTIKAAPATSMLVPVGEIQPGNAHAISPMARQVKWVTNGGGKRFSKDFMGISSLGCSWRLCSLRR